MLDRAPQFFANFVHPRSALSVGYREQSLIVGAGRDLLEKLALLAANPEFKIGTAGKIVQGLRSATSVPIASLTNWLQSGRDCSPVVVPSLDVLARGITSAASSTSSAKSFRIRARSAFTERMSIRTFDHPWNAMTRNPPFRIVLDVPNALIRSACGSNPARGHYGTFRQPCRGEGQ
jgi:hypothetical protein